MTNIFDFAECHNFDGECVKPGKEFDDHCMTYRCKNNGKLDRVAASKTSRVKGYLIVLQSVKTCVLRIFDKCRRLKN